MSHNSRESNRFFAPICDFDPQLPPNGGREGGNDMIKYFGYKCLVNRPLIIEIYENALGYFYCLLHTVRVKVHKKLEITPKKICMIRTGDPFSDLSVMVEGFSSLSSSYTLSR